MKTLILILLALLVAPCVGMTEKEAGYIAGIEDGYELGYLAHSGLGNATAAQVFNDQANRYNAYLERIGGQEYKLATLPMPDLSYMPAFLRDYHGTDPWAGVPGSSTISSNAANLQRPIVVANNTTGNGIIHAVDGNSKATGPKYTTNDINALPTGAIENYQKVGDVDPVTGKRINGDGYLGGV